ncbi:MAG: GNAT family N-acetyltransferase, partial [Planctomycetota bacterium]
CVVKAIFWELYMDPLQINTPRLKLVLNSPEEMRAAIQAMDEATREQVSAEWLARVEQADVADPWIHGFQLRLLDDDSVVGRCGFKAPPADGMVEIAYGVEPDYEGRGFATECAAAMTDYALEQDGVLRVWAHTLPEENASGSVLKKCGFTKVGEVVDPDDGPVWRWEKQ